MTTAQTPGAQPPAPPLDRTIRWAPAEGVGLEYLKIKDQGDRILAESLLIGSNDGTEIGLRYRIALDRDWRVMDVSLALVGGASLHLTSDGAGHWRDGMHAALPGLDGCIDIDISMTPFTNTLPIRRLRLGQGEARDIKVAYIAVPDLRPVAVEQRYTCVERGRRYRYDGLSTNFTRELPVDQDGLVLDYPGIWVRA